MVHKRNASPSLLAGTKWDAFPVGPPMEPKRAQKVPNGAKRRPNGTNWQPCGTQWVPNGHPGGSPYNHEAGDPRIIVEMGTPSIPKTMAWDLRLGITGLGSLAWDGWLGIFIF